MDMAAALILALVLVRAPPSVFEHNSNTLRFSYAVPSDAAAIPALEKYLKSERQRLLTRERDNADDDRQSSRENHFPFRKHVYSKKWRLVGASGRLLSLEADLEWDTGGAHPNSSTESLLWDKKLNRPISVGYLFARGGAFPTLTRTLYCQKLNLERRKRRRGANLGSYFDHCPPFAELAIAPTDSDKNGRFDSIDFVAPPYVAGPYVEGPYTVRLNLSPAIVGALKPAFRSSFEAHRQ